MSIRTVVMGSAPQPRRLHERLLLAAADVQGDTPIGPVPIHPEDELDEFIQTGNIDRVALIGAFTECERRGWMDLLKVMGPWHWQVTYHGLETADRMRAEDFAARKELEAADQGSGVDVLSADIEASAKVEGSATGGPVRGEEFAWDVFLAHASEDKVTFADDLAKALYDLGLAVWYDDFELVVGDSLGRRIDDGLARSEFGIVLLSPNFFAKEWPQKELDGLLEKERNGETVILPVWHEIDHDGVARFSPTLAGRMSARSDEGATAVAQKLQQAMHRHRMRRIPKAPSS